MKIEVKMGLYNPFAKKFRTASEFDILLRELYYIVHYSYHAELRVCKRLARGEISREAFERSPRRLFFQVINYGLQYGALRQRKDVEVPWRTDEIVLHFSAQESLMRCRTKPGNPESFGVVRCQGGLRFSEVDLEMADETGQGWASPLLMANKWRYAVKSVFFEAMEIGKRHVRAANHEGGEDGNEDLSKLLYGHLFELQSLYKYDADDLVFYAVPEWPKAEGDWSREWPFEYYRFEAAFESFCRMLAAKWLYEAEKQHNRPVHRPR